MSWIRRRQKSEWEIFARIAYRKGMNPLLRRAKFKRPGGGWTWYRDRPWTDTVSRRDTIGVTTSVVTRDDRYGKTLLTLAVEAISSLGRPGITVRLVGHEVFFDFGDPMDLAVALHDWLRTDGLRCFDQVTDVAALAQRAEERYPRDKWGLSRIAGLWRLAGRPDKAAQAEALKGEPF